MNIIVGGKKKKKAVELFLGIVSWHGLEEKAGSDTEHNVPYKH